MKANRALRRPRPLRFPPPRRVRAPPFILNESAPRFKRFSDFCFSALNAVKNAPICRVDGFVRNDAAEKVRASSLLLNPDAPKADLTVATASTNRSPFRQKSNFRDDKIFLKRRRASFEGRVFPKKSKKRANRARRPAALFVKIPEAFARRVSARSPRFPYSPQPADFPRSSQPANSP